MLCVQCAPVTLSSRRGGRCPRRGHRAGDSTQRGQSEPGRTRGQNRARRYATFVLSSFVLRFPARYEEYYSMLQQHNWKFSSLNDFIVDYEALSCLSSWGIIRTNNISWHDKQDGRITALFGAVWIKYDMLFMTAWTSYLPGGIGVIWSSNRNRNRFKYRHKPPLIMRHIFINWAYFVHFFLAFALMRGLLRTPLAVFTNCQKTVP